MTVFEQKSWCIPNKENLKEFGKKLEYIWKASVFLASPSGPNNVPFITALFLQSHNLPQEHTYLNC